VRYDPAAPEWLGRLAAGLDPLQPAWEPVPDGDRPSAVLALLSRADDPDLVVTVRAAGLQFHAGQLSFPGGGREPGDVNPADTALRETREEIGLDSARVTVVGQLPVRPLSASRNRVVPVVGLWCGADVLLAGDPREVERLVRWPVSALADPVHRVSARHPRGGTGPAFVLDDFFLWGFTAGLADRLLRLGGWEQPWDAARVVEVPRRFSGDRDRSRSAEPRA